MNDYGRSAQARNANLKSLNAGARSHNSSGYSGGWRQSSDPTRRTDANEVGMFLRLRRGEAIAVVQGTAHNSLDAGEVFRKFGTDPRSLYEAGPQIREMYKEALAGKTFTARDVSDDVLLTLENIVNGA